MEEIIMNNNKIISLLFEEEEEEDEMYNQLKTNKRKSIDSFFTTREDEGFFEILINGHLHNNKQKFLEFFRINYDQFMLILSLIKDDIKLPPSKCVKKPIQPDKKHTTSTTKILSSFGKNVDIIVFDIIIV
jgi:hypothetical protein